MQKIEREVEAAVALGNSATAKNPIPEVRMAMSDLTSYFNWFKQLVELRGMALGRAVEFFKKAKEVIFVLMPLSCDKPVCTFPAGDHYTVYAIDGSHFVLMMSAGSHFVLMMSAGSHFIW